ncbi:MULTISPECIES: MATE family efflux transporter [unclassified Butyrivibrio]|uniref:MATE family efflux transporter n=1 Tax=unclassified Butyrivibrio TaxID=2639466 RepID=UPI0003F6A921|nr:MULTISPECIES: MATE family efflux transporter [unclassified Butyrivibrio]
MSKQNNFTEGPILGPLLKFAIPVLFALFLQSLYGAVDLMIVGKFAAAADVSGVSTGSQIMMTLTNFVSALSMGMTVFLGQKIGEKKAEEGGEIVANGIMLFFTIGIALTLLIPVFAPGLASLMNAPAEAFDLTVSYIRICGLGIIVIISYNLIGSIFRGLGDSMTPLITVLIACIFNIVGDLALVAGFGMGTKGAAIATVAAQFISVAISLVMIKRKTLPFTISRKCFVLRKEHIAKILFIGTPIALQDFLVGISFLVILAIVNSLGLVASAGVGVAQKVCGFIMLIPSAFAQSMSAFVSQNRGAGKFDRAFKGLRYAIGVSFIVAIVMFYAGFFHGDLLSGIFANDTDVIAASWDYLKAYAIDCLFTCFLFCFIGFFNGMEYTKFVMVQGIIGAFLVRIPVSYIMSKQDPVSLFYIGLATPCSTVMQIIMCFGCLFYLKKKLNYN